MLAASNNRLSSNQGDRVEKKAAGLLGEEVVAGSIISTSGTGRTTMKSGMAGGAGGLIGGVIGGLAVDKLAGKGGPASPLAGHEGLMYLAVTPTRLAFFTIKQGLLGSSPKELITTLPRESVQRIEVGTGKMTSPVTLAMTEGPDVVLEVPRLHRGKVEKIAGLFNGS
jgi:hypothetical protein